jgi:hypothetical protein
MLRPLPDGQSLSQGHTHAARQYRSRDAAHRRPLYAPLPEVFAGIKRAERRQTILRAHIVHGYLLTEIANYLELHPTTISRIVNQTGSYRLTRE